MKLTKSDKVLIHQALHLAIMTEENFIDCHKIGYSRKRDKDGQLIRVVPVEYRSLIVKTKWRIERFRKMCKRLQEDAKNSK